MHFGYFRQWVAILGARSSGWTGGFVAEQRGMLRVVREEASSESRRQIQLSVFIGLVDC